MTYKRVELDKLWQTLECQFPQKSKEEITTQPSMERIQMWKCLEHCSNCGKAMGKWKAKKQGWP